MSTTNHNVPSDALSRIKASDCRDAITRRSHNWWWEYIFSQQRTACNTLRHAHSRMLLLLLSVYPEGGARFDVAEGLHRRRRWAVSLELRPARQLPLPRSNAPFTCRRLARAFLRSLACLEPNPRLRAKSMY